MTAVVRIIARQVGEIDSRRGGARFLSKLQAQVLRSFAGGLAGTVMGAAAPLPADIAGGSYGGHIFPGNAENYCHLPGLRRNAALAVAPTALAAQFPAP